jgi:hypothetical protein
MDELLYTIDNALTFNSVLLKHAAEFKQYQLNRNIVDPRARQPGENRAAHRARLKREK